MRSMEKDSTYEQTVELVQVAFVAQLGHEPYAVLNGGGGCGDSRLGFDTQ